MLPSSRRQQTIGSVRPRQRQSKRGKNGRCSLQTRRGRVDRYMSSGLILALQTSRTRAAHAYSAPRNHRVSETLLPPSQCNDDRVPNIVQIGPGRAAAVLQTASGNADSTSASVQNLPVPPNSHAHRFSSPLSSKLLDPIPDAKLHIAGRERGRARRPHARCRLPTLCHMRRRAQPRHVLYRLQLPSRHQSLETVRGSDHTIDAGRNG